MSAVTRWPEAPSQGRTIFPPLAAACSVLRTRLVGMAKPMPTEPPDCEKIAVLMPTSVPSRSTSAPPELPGLIAASVWMKERKSLMPIGARQAGDDAAGDGLADAERIADRQHEIADLELIAVADLQHRQALAMGVELEHGEIGALVGEQEVRLEFASIGEHHGDLLRIADDVVVGDDEAGGIEDDAGAQRLLDALARHAERRLIAEEATEERIVEERGRPTAAPDDAAREDIDHRRRHLLHHRREGQMNDFAARRHARLRRGGKSER